MKHKIDNGSVYKRIAKDQNSINQNASKHAPTRDLFSIFWECVSISIQPEGIISSKLPRKLAIRILPESCCNADFFFNLGFENVKCNKDGTQSNARLGQDLFFLHSPCYLGLSVMRKERQNWVLYPN